MKAVLIALAVSLSALESASSAASYDNTPATTDREKASRLVVMIQSDFEGAARFGAGIVVGMEGRDVYVVTANHVVRRPNDAGGLEVGKVSVTLRGILPESVEVLPVFALKRDVAVLKVRLAAPDAQQVAGWDFAILASAHPQATAEDDPIYMLGQPQGRRWRMNGSPEHLKLVSALLDEPVYEFESALLDAGHSGGALLNGELQIIGMIRGETAPYGQAVPIVGTGTSFEPVQDAAFNEDSSSIAQLMAHWRLPFQLRHVRPGLLLGENYLCHDYGRGSPLACYGTAPWIPAGEDGPANTYPLGDERVRSAASGAEHLCAVTVSSEVFCLGRNLDGRLGIPASERTYQVPVSVQGAPVLHRLAAGGRHTCGLSAQGVAYCWGANESGQLGDGSTVGSHVPVRVAGTMRFSSISAGEKHTCAVSWGQTLFCWGDSTAIGTRFYVAEQARSTLVPVQLQLVSPPQRMRFSANEPPSAPIMDSIQAVAAGSDYSCAVEISLALYCWGRNAQGRLGFPGARERSEPVRVGGELRFRAVAVGRGHHSCGLSTEGQIYCWGANQFGQLGDGTKNPSATPVRASTNRLFSEVAVTEGTTCGIDSKNNEILCWGKVALDRSGTPERLRPEPLYRVILR